MTSAGCQVHREGHAVEQMAQLAGPLGMLPGMAFYIAMMGYYDAIGTVALSSAFRLAKLQAHWFGAGCFRAFQGVVKAR